MAADATFTFEAKGAEKIVSGLASIETGTRKTAKSANRTGFAILEASRALEDFSMAGMRGALNNIPGLLMNLGIGAGLTGVVSALTVGVWKGVEAFEALRNAAREQIDMEIGGGLETFNIGALEQQFSEKATKMAKDIEPVIKSIADQTHRVISLNKLDDSVETAAREMYLAKELLDLKKKGASVDELRSATNRKLISDIEAQEQAASRDISARVAQIANLNDELMKQKAIVKQVPEGILDDINKQVRGVYITRSKEMMAEGVRPETAEQLARQEADWKRENMIQLLAGGKQQLEQKLQESFVAKERIKLLDAELASTRKILREEEERAEAGEIISARKKSTLEFTELAKQAEEEASRVKGIMDRAMGTSFTSESFLSPQGKAGLAGNEIKAAMDDMNIQRQQLKSLVEIARNTKKLKPAYQ